MYGITGFTTYRSSGTGGVARAARTAAIVIAFFLGTGSVQAAPGVERLNSYFKPKQETKFTVAEKGQLKVVNLDFRGPNEHLDNIKSVLNLPVSEMASLFGVTRQSIYKWTGNQATPDDENLAKIAELSQLADLFKEAQVSRPLDMVKMKAFQGKSVLDLFKGGEPFMHLATVLVKESRIADESYARSGLSQLKTAKTDGWKSSISIPFSNEA
ncbi:helix-turn-helix transcriptional regulator [Pantoea sp. Cy-639]|uniref:helix-turn-helix domain-containing protein n=1 Tax=Pantoea sp. Cy-639 TaxID=2608360 RepID=UPI00141EEAC4|nr:helix-turn-helix transcriptional regulator [Pantoea sp. Cy-639]NIF18855.1 helix-turn-helix transcriptional regulator [Pantoea sp. Cy-639]